MLLPCSVLAKLLQEKISAKRLIENVVFIYEYVFFCVEETKPSEFSLLAQLKAANSEPFQPNHSGKNFLPKN